MGIFGKNDSLPRNIRLSEDAEKKFLKQQKKTAKAERQRERAERDRLRAERDAIRDNAYAERERAEELHEIEKQAAQEQADMEGMRSFIESMEGSGVSQKELAQMYLDNLQKREKLKKEEERKDDRRYWLSVAGVILFLIFAVAALDECGRKEDECGRKEKSSNSWFSSITIKESNSSPDFFISD